LFAFVAVGYATAQEDSLNSPFELQATPDGGIINAFDPAAIYGEPATVSAYFTPATADQPAMLVVMAQIAAGSHTYSLTQTGGGLQPTKIELAPSKEYRLLAGFRSLTPPNTHVDKEGYQGIKVEEHEGLVTWFAPIEISAGVNPQQLAIRGDVRMIVCSASCVPVNKSFTAQEGRLTSPDIRAEGWPLESAIGHPQSTVASFQSKNSAAKFSGKLVPSAVRPGESAELRITASVAPHNHIYALAERDAPLGSKPTLIAVQTASGLTVQPPATDAIPIVDNSIPAFGIQRYHEGDVTWTQKIEVPKNAASGDYPIVGLIGYQVCKSGGQCETPTAVRFATTLKVGDEPSQTDAPLTFAPGESYPKVAAAAAALADSFGGQKAGAGGSAAVASTNADQNPTAAAPAASGPAYDLGRIVRQESAQSSLAYYITLAFVGGLILNLMPCVLPVIGLKVMSFVEQSGKNRGHAFILNVWFAAGIISVFLILALLASLPRLGLGEEGLGWGGQNGSVAFNVTIASIVFAMALSLLGVWEIPIPGFFGSGSVQSAAAKEGALGAFLKGVVTTILATPCTAPLMAAAITWGVSQPVVTTLIVFATVGLGMASPYLLIGVYPELLRFLPKPGAWMETFKQVSGFLLLATVVYILSYLEPLAVVPTLLLLLGIGIACWFVARTPLTAEFGARLRSWAAAAVVLLLFTGGFGVMYRLAIAPVDKSWQPFSLERLHQVAVNEGKTVLVDFSAEWCPTCKVLEKFVLHTPPVEQAIKSSNVVTMYADYTDYSPEIKRTINALGSVGIPVVAIFPGGAPYEPIVFIDGYRQKDIIGAIAEAESRRGGTQVSRESQPAALTPAVMR
jgi:thiol:disulfide interchange protein